MRLVVQRRRLIGRPARRSARRSGRPARRSRRRTCRPPSTTTPTSDAHRRRPASRPIGTTPIFRYYAYDGRPRAADAAAGDAAVGGRPVARRAASTSASPRRASAPDVGTDVQQPDPQPEHDMRLIADCARAARRARLHDGDGHGRDALRHAAVDRRAVGRAGRPQARRARQVAQGRLRGGRGRRPELPLPPLPGPQLLGEVHDRRARRTRSTSRWNGVAPAADPRTLVDARRARTSRYTIELLPANGAAACSTANPDATMIDADVGHVQDPRDRPGRRERRRSARSSRRSSARASSTTCTSPTRRRAARACTGSTSPAATRARTAAGSATSSTWARERLRPLLGRRPDAGRPRARSSTTASIERDARRWEVISDPALTATSRGFKAGDVIAGPMHTNDEIMIDCGSAGAEARRLARRRDRDVEPRPAGSTDATAAGPDDRAGTAAAARRT